MADGREGRVPADQRAQRDGADIAGGALEIAGGGLPKVQGGALVGVAAGAVGAGIAALVLNRGK